MPLFRSCPFEDLVVQATSEKNVTDDWGLILDICDKVVNYEEGPKLILQAIMKRLYSIVPRVVLQALLLLDSCVKNCGRRFHLEVSSRNFINEVGKLLQKMHPGTVDKFKGLIKKWAENDFKDDSELGLIPSLYYKLKSEGVQFPEDITEKKTAPALCTNPDAVNSQEEEEDIVKAIAMSLKETKRSDLYSSDILNTPGISEPLKIELLRVRALYDFEAVEDNELTIKAGEVIVVTDKSNDSWWKGSNQRGEGYFPVSFVTEDLKAPIELVEEETPKPLEVVAEVHVEKPLEMDEEKIQMALHLLNETDPTDECPDDEILLSLERECYAMSPLIEEKLQKLDKKCTVLNSLNEEIMKAIQIFYKLTRDSAAAHPSQYVYYNAPTDGAQTNQHPPQEGAAAQPNYQHFTSLPRGLPRQVVNPVTDSSFYVPPGYLPNLTNLSSTQIRQNVASIPFAHPSQFHSTYHGTLPSKLNNGQPMTNLRVAYQNVPFPAAAPGQEPSKTNASGFEGNTEHRTVTPASNSANHEALSMAQTDTTNGQQNYGRMMQQHIPISSTVTRNATYADGVK